MKCDCRKKYPKKHKCSKCCKLKCNCKKMKGGFPRRYFDDNNIIENWPQKVDPNLMSRHTSAMKQLGGGSDFIPTVTSRGPVNYPSTQGTNMSGEQLFKTFSKTGTYIPNESLNRASVLTDGILGYKLAGGKRFQR
jgi:hypothetical protein